MIRIRRLSLIFCLIVNMLLLNGCAGMEAVNDMMSTIGDLFADDDNSDPPAVLPEEFLGEMQVDLIWKETVGDGADNKNVKLIPVIVANRVFIADHKGRIQARQISDGDLVWETKTTFPFAAGPVIGQQFLIVGTSHGEVNAYDFVTGEQKWTTLVSSEVLAVPVVSKGKIIIRTTDGKVTALRESDGAMLWSVENSVPALSIRGAGAPLALDETVIIGGANGKLSALQVADGKSLWEATITVPSGRSEVERLVDLDTDPLEIHGNLFISSYQGGTTAASAVDGEVIWRNESLSTYTGITADYRYLYLSDSRSEVSQLDQRNGAALWKQKDLHNRQLTEAVVYNNFVVVGDFEGYVHWLSITDGRLLARIKITKGAIAARPVVVDGVVYIYAKDGTLAALRAK
jgi:outer membrane protein assembly factor BamB